MNSLDAREKDLRAKIDASTLDAGHKRKLHVGTTTIFEFERSTRRANRVFWLLVAIAVAWIVAEIWLL